MNFNIELTDEQSAWATAAWQGAVTRGEATDATVSDYLARILTPVVSDTVTAIISSWKPVDDPEVRERRAAAAAKLETVSTEVLASVEEVLNSPT